MSIDFGKKSGVFWIFCCIKAIFVLLLIYQIAYVVSCEFDSVDAVM